MCEDGWLPPDASPATLVPTWLLQFASCKAHRVQNAPNPKNLRYALQTMMHFHQWQQAALDSRPCHTWHQRLQEIHARETAEVWGRSVGCWAVACACAGECGRRVCV